MGVDDRRETLEPYVLWQNLLDLRMIILLLSYSEYIVSRGLKQCLEL